MDNKICITTTKQEHTAVLLRDKLTSAGIETIILDQKETVSSVVGGYGVYVDQEKEAEAKKIVAAFNHE